MTRAGVLKLGLGLLIAGGAGFWLFKAAGFEGFSAGIAAEAVLVVIVVVSRWVSWWARLRLPFHSAPARGKVPHSGRCSHGCTRRSRARSERGDNKCSDGTGASLADSVSVGPTLAALRTRTHVIMPTVLVVLVRHGERLDEADPKEWRRVRTEQTRSDPPLTATGIAQSRKWCLPLIHLATKRGQKFARLHFGV